MEQTGSRGRAMRQRCISDGLRTASGGSRGPSAGIGRRVSADRGHLVCESSLTRSRSWGGWHGERRHPGNVGQILGKQQAQALRSPLRAAHGLAPAVEGLPHAGNRRMIVDQEPAYGKCRLSMLSFLAFQHSFREASIKAGLRKTN